MSETETAGVIAPPPLIFLTAVVLGWLLDRALPQSILAAPVTPWIGGALALAGLALGGAAVRTMRSARTAVSPYQGSAALVMTGPFARSRNPIYVAMVVLSLGLSLLLNSLWCVVLLLPAVLTVRFGVIAREEAYLERRFGEAFRRYCASTPRWL